MKNLAILGSTGSIGMSALSVVDAYPDRLRVVSLAAGDNSDRMSEQHARYQPEVLAMANGAAMDRLRTIAKNLPDKCGTGPDGLIAVATHPDVDLVICASAGTAGLEAVLAAIRAGKTIALANKEILVMAGQLVMAAAREYGVSVLPVDSEHNAIHQCLHGRNINEIRRVILTASGGPFRGESLETLNNVGPEAALRHPTWKMGKKITIDSATLMNKGLEVIEARWLFGMSPQQIDVVIHPQSVVHSLVELIDGSVIAQLGVTDMRLPIQYACSYPDRWGSLLPQLDLVRSGRLDFYEPEHDRFPCLSLAYRALSAEASLPVVLNAANEVAVNAFLEGKVAFTSIARIIEQTMDDHTPSSVDTLTSIQKLNIWAHDHASQIVLELNSQVTTGKA